MKCRAKGCEAEAVSFARLVVPISGREHELVTTELCEAHRLTAEQFRKLIKSGGLVYHLTRAFYILGFDGDFSKARVKIFRQGEG